MFSGSQHKDEAWKLVEYLSEPAQQLELYELTGDLPPRRAVWDHERFAGNPRTAAFRVQLQALRSTPKIPEWERITEKITRYAEAAVRGSMTAEEALVGLDEDVDRILEKRRWLLSPESRGRDRGAGARGRELSLMKRHALGVTTELQEVAP